MPKHGWIQDPRTSETKRFHPDEKSWHQDPRVFVDSGRPVPGEAPLLKTRVHLRRDTAELLGKSGARGWRTCTLNGDVEKSERVSGSAEFVAFTHA